MSTRGMRWLGLLAVAGAIAASASCGGSSCKCMDPAPYGPRTVAPDEPTALGFSADEVKARLAGPWVGPLAWVADPTQVTAQPATGETTVTIALRYAFDERSIIAVEPTDTYTDASASFLHLELPVHLLLTTADGALAEDLPTAIRATSVSQGSVLDLFGASRGTPVQGSYTATAVNAARYLATEDQLTVDLAPATATGRLILLGLGSEKSADGRSDTKIADELLVATFAATAVADTGQPDGGAGPVDGASPDGSAGTSAGFTVAACQAETCGTEATICGWGSGDAKYLGCLSDCDLLGIANASCPEKVAALYACASLGAKVDCTTGKGTGCDREEQQVAMCLQSPDGGS
jgi:hypothetical protein